MGRPRSAGYAPKPVKGEVVRPLPDGPGMTDCMGPGTVDRPHKFWSQNALRYRICSACREKQDKISPAFRECVSAGSE